MAKVDVNGVNIHYQAKGDGSDVVLVHGLTSSLAFWYATKVFPVLSKDFRVTAYDLRGHGYSDTTPSGYTSHDLAIELRGLLDTLGIQRARLIGHSYGGSVVLHFALLFPERTAGAVICDTGFASLRHLRRTDNWAGWEIWKQELPEFGITPDWFAQADLKGVNTILEKSVNIPVQFGLRRGESRDTPRFRKQLNETTVGTDFSDPAGLTEELQPGISPAVLAMYGETSPFCNVAGYLAQTLPCCAAELLPDMGHFFLMQAADLFLARVKPFLVDPARFVQGRKQASPGRGAVAGPA
jgi:pimeloyl-ACP methyl ester carboxylesterase